MDNIVSYLKWRGDIRLPERLFCDVDNLVLSELAYLDFTGIVPSPSDGGSVLVSDAAERLEQWAKGAGITFDPAVINDDGVIRLYHGAGYSIFANMEDFLTRGFVNKLTTMVIGKTPEQVKAEPDGIHGPVHVTLSDDMLTVTSEPVKFMPSKTKGTQWDGHAFFEAASIRKIDGTYYFLYSSWNNHDLCHATSAYPDRNFTCRGVIISNGDVEYEGRKPKDRLNFTGNNHGSLVQIRGQWYIFYHRHTHDNMYQRQGCAEPVTIREDGSIPQVEMTSCRLNGGPLSGKGVYPASI